MENQDEPFKENELAFLNYIAEIQEKRLSQVAVRKANKKYDVRNSKIDNVTPLRAKKIYAALLTKYATGGNNGKNWLQNQRRLFIWCIICYLYKSGKQIHELQKDDDFKFFENVFIGKDRNLLKFQTFSLIKRNNKNTGWKNEEDEILSKIVEKNTDQIKEWSQISKQFFQASNQLYFRNSKQCRERWLNHLDPNKIKGKWLPEQDKLLLSGVLEKGKKWSQIVPILESKKNEHMIKNRYKSLLHKKQKQMNFKNMKENQIIALVIDDLQNQINPEKDKKFKNNKILEDIELEKYIEDSSMKNVVESPKQTSKRVLRARKKRSDMAQQSSEQRENVVQNQYIVPKMANCLIVQPKNQMQLRMKEKSSIENNSKEKREIDFDNERNQFEENAQYLDDQNKKGENELYEKLFQSANTPIGDSRFPSIIMDARSPANFLVSPYPPNTWTPTIFLFDDQRQVSPQISYQNSFGSKISSNFHKFVEGENDEKE